MSKQKQHDNEERIEGAEVTGTGTPDTQGDAAGRSDNASARSNTELDAVAASLSDALKTVADRETRIAALESEVSSLKDQYLRKLADYENFRKRMFREKEDAVQFANSNILSDLVGVMDNFDRAVQSSETSRDFQGLHDGVDMIRKGLLGLLESKYGLSRFDSLGVVFDPNVHEAVMCESGDCAEPLVIEEFVKGYKLRDRVLRSAKVKVRMPVEGGAATGSEENTSDTNA